MRILIAILSFIILLLCTLILQLIGNQTGKFV